MVDFNRLDVDTTAVSPDDQREQQRRAFINAPLDDEPYTEEERQLVAQARLSRQRDGTLTLDEVIALLDSDN